MGVKEARLSGHRHPARSRARRVEGAAAVVGTLAWLNIIRGNLLSNMFCVHVSQGI